jgi:AraC-like DNA-binding protein
MGVAIEYPTFDSRGDVHRAVVDVVRLSGYYDQAHLTRSLKYRIGQTPTELR